MALRNLVRAMAAVGAITVALMHSCPTAKSDAGLVDVPTPSSSAWSSPTPTYPLTLPPQTPVTLAFDHVIAQADPDNSIALLVAPVFGSIEQRYRDEPSSQLISIQSTVISVVIDFIPVTTGNPFAVPFIRFARVHLTNIIILVIGQQSSLYSIAMILSIVFFTYKVLLAIWHDSTRLLLTIKKLQDQENKSAKKIAEQDESLIDCRKQLADKTLAADEAENGLQDERKNNKENATELEDARLAIGMFQTRMVDKCRKINALENEKTNASKDIKLLKKQLSDAHRSSRAQHTKYSQAYDSLKEVEVAASKKVRELEDEIRRIPRWSDSNIAKFTSLQRSNNALQQSLNEATAQNEDTTARLKDSQAAHRELRLYFDAEKRQKDWLEIAVDRKTEDVRAAEHRHSQTKAKLMDVQGSLDSANKRLDLAAADIVRLEQIVASLEKEKVDLSANDMDIRRTNATLESRVAQLEAQVAESGLLADARKEVEDLNAELDEERSYHASLEGLISGRDALILSLGQGRDLAQEEAKALGLVRDDLQAQLGRVTEDVAAANERVATLQDEKVALLDDMAGVERRRDELVQENERLTNAPVRSHQEEEIRAEYERQFRALAAQGEEWVQGVIQGANTYAQEQEQRATDFESELHSTRVAMENLRSLAMEFERQALASLGIPGFPSPPITPLAFGVQELQPAQVNQATVELPAANQSIPVFSIGVPQPTSTPSIFPTPHGNGVSLSGPVNGYVAAAQEARSAPSQATVPNTHGPGAPQVTALGNTNAGIPPIAGPSTNPTRLGRGVRALPQKVGGRFVRLQGTTQAPVQPTTTSGPSATGSSQAFQPQPVVIDSQVLGPSLAGPSSQPSGAASMSVNLAGIPFAGSSAPNTQWQHRG